MRATTPLSWPSARPGGAPVDAETARQFPANPTRSLWYKDQNPITAETERTR